MKKVMEKMMVRFGGSIATLALVLTVVSANSPCRFLDYQPELPKGAEKLKKIK